MQTREASPLCEHEALGEIPCRAKSDRRRSRLGAKRQDKRGSAVSREVRKILNVKRSNFKCIRRRVAPLSREARKDFDKGLFGRVAPPARPKRLEKSGPVDQIFEIKFAPKSAQI